MSVINKMLRDLDQRRNTKLPDAPVNLAVPRPDVPHKSMRSTMWVRITLIALALLAVLSGIGWFWMQSDHAPTATAPAPAPAPVASELLPPVAPMAVASAPMVAASQPIAVASAETIAVSDPTPKAPPTASPAKAAAAPIGTPRTPPRLATDPAAAIAPAASTMSLRMESTLPARKALEALLSAPDRSKATNAPSEQTPMGSRQQQAGGDALAQAQTLWSAGSHTQAIELMQQSVDAAERSVKAGNSMVGSPVLLSMVRELVRMEMAQARFAAVWDLLTRLEPVLGNQADLWAVRANSAQRLGRHQDSVSAYRMALQSRPDEQRWLLGAAVSMAALGQISQAAEMAEKARSVGEISPDVQAYLRQMGVPITVK